MKSGWVSALFVMLEWVQRKSTQMFITSLKIPKIRKIFKELLRRKSYARALTVVTRWSWPELQPATVRPRLESCFLLQGRQEEKALPLGCQPSSSGALHWVCTRGRWAFQLKGEPLQRTYCIITVSQREAPNLLPAFGLYTQETKANFLHRWDGTEPDGAPFLRSRPRPYKALGDPRYITESG